MKKLLIAAAALLLSFTVAPLAYADPTPAPGSGQSGSEMEYVPLEAMAAGGPSVQESNPGEKNPDGSGEIISPAGPEVMNQVPAAPQIDANGAPKAPASAANKGGYISRIDPNAATSFAAGPIDSIPGAVSFVFIMLLCIGVGVGSAVVISLVTGKKIDFGLSRS